MRIGLLGGSFNPAHHGHLHIAQAMRRRLRLHQIWLLVSPGNPLKRGAGMAPFTERLHSAASLADGRRIIATGIEAQLSTRYSIDTIRALRRRFPRVRFVWLMGSDSFAELPRWRQWMRFARTVPIAVHARAMADRAALTQVAAHRLVHARMPGRAAAALADAAAPAWVHLALALHAQSSTALRATKAGQGAPLPGCTGQSSLALPLVVHSSHPEPAPAGPPRSPANHPISQPTPQPSRGAACRPPD